MASFKQISLNCSGHTRPVVHLDFSDITECGYFLISACKDGNPMLRQGETGDWIGTFEGHKGAVWGVALNRQATQAATGAADFTAKLWDAVSGDILHTFDHVHIVKSVNFSSNDELLVTASNEKLLRVFDLNQPETGGAKVEFPSTPNSLEVSRDGLTLTVTHGSKVSFLNSETLEKIGEVTVPTKCYSASLHPDKHVFVCGGEDLKVYKFDFSSGEEIESNKGHFGPVHCIRFSPDGELYASGSEDGTVRMWQTRVGKSYGLWRCTDGVALSQPAGPPTTGAGAGNNSEDITPPLSAPDTPPVNGTSPTGLKEVAAN